MNEYRFRRAYVEIGNVCNLSCSFCPGTRRAPRQMTAEEFRRVLTEIRPYSDVIYFHVMGEPLFHPNLGEFLSIARELAFRVSITTNGTLLRSTAELLFSYADIIHKVSVSLHSAESNGGVSEDYLGAVIDFAERASNVGIYAVLRLWNLDSEEREGENRENAVILDRLHAAFPEEWVKRYNGYRMTKGVFLEYAEIFTWPTESEAEPVETGYCHGLLDQIAVLTDGTVVPCCLDADGEIALGNLFLQSMEEILASERLRAMEAGLRSGRFTEALCRRCTYARRFHK